MSEPLTHAVRNSPEGRTAESTALTAASMKRMAELIETQVQLIAYIDREREKRDAERDAERREREDALEELRHAREGLAEEIGRAHV